LSGFWLIVSRLVVDAEQLEQGMVAKQAMGALVYFATWLWRSF
jgi:hypothetical protein